MSFLSVFINNILIAGDTISSWIPVYHGITHFNAVPDNVGI
jgi:hypothetical protein